MIPRFITILFSKYPHVSILKEKVLPKQAQTRHQLSDATSDVCGVVQISTGPFTVRLLAGSKVVGR